jgi:RimJ/RimL family protein N-acetyltransferase
MIKGIRVSLKPVAENDLEDLHRGLLDIESRGPWYPMPRMSFTKLRTTYEEDGLWSPDEGLFLIVGDEGRIVGTVDWERLNGSVPDVEVAYHVFDRADWGKGIASEALDLFAGWLFDSQSMNRLLLYIHVDNIASRRVAEKCGFSKEATSRQAWYSKGAWHDVDVYIQTRGESDARRRIG